MYKQWFFTLIYSQHHKGSKDIALDHLAINVEVLYTIYIYIYIGCGKNNPLDFLQFSHESLGIAKQNFTDIFI